MNLTLNVWVESLFRDREARWYKWSWWSDSVHCNGSEIDTMNAIAARHFCIRTFLRQ